MRDTILKKTKKFLRPILLCFGVLLAVIIISRLTLYLLPFFVAFVLSTLIEPIVCFFQYRFRFPRKLASALTIFLFAVVFFLLFMLILSRIISELVSISTFLPGYLSEAVKNIDSIIKKWSEVYIGLPPEITKNIEIFLADLSANLLKFLNSIIKLIFNTAISIPQILFFIIMTVLSTYFISSDKDKIFNYFKSKLPVKFVCRVRNTKNELFYALFGYIKAQLILMGIIFSELFTGFIIMHIHEPFILAFMISMIDALPIFGTGSVLVPWLLYEFMIGNTRLGMSLLILYAIVIIVRQMVEPKILSFQIGIHPLLTLITMYAGLRMFGVIGFILGPIAAIVIKNIISGWYKDKLV